MAKALSTDEDRDRRRPIVLPATKRERAILRQLRAAVSETSLQNLLRDAVCRYAEFQNFPLQPTDFQRREDPDAD
jgi:hypothetical protein